MDNTLSNISKMLYYIRTGSQELTSAGLDLLENQVDNPGITDLQDSLIELLKAEQRVNAFSNSINHLKTRWQKGELDDSVDIVKVLEDSLKEEESKHDDVNVWEHEFMKNFIDQIRQVDKSVPLCFGPNGQANSGSTSEIHVTKALTGTKCPITQLDINEPFKDSSCGHTFERTAILSHLKQCQKKKKKAKCPFQGCTNIIQSANLQENTAMRRDILAKRKGESSSLQLHN